VDRAVGLDISDKWTVVCVITMATGEEVEQGRVRTRPDDLRQRFAGIEPMRIALEVGAHSPWMSRLLEELGHEVLVANASKVALIHGNARKRDRADAEHLARLARLDPRLLHPLRHRSEQAQHDLSVLRSRDQLVQLRTGLINHVRGVLKALGHPPPSCTTAGRVGVPGPMAMNVPSVRRTTDAPTPLANGNTPPNVSSRAPVGRIRTRLGPNAPSVVAPLRTRAPVGSNTAAFARKLAGISVNAGCTMPVGDKNSTLAGPTPVTRNSANSPEGPTAPLLMNEPASGVVV
jgi:hypothetical protein